MKTLICLCVALSAIGIALGQFPFGDIMNKAMGAAGSAAQAMSGMAGGGNPMTDMFAKAEELFKQATEGAANPGAAFGQQIMEMAQQAMGQMNQKAQEAMMPLMQEMMQMNENKADPKQMMALLEKMKKIKGA
ncbi:hypothetical protein NPIL_370011 [Nephila pilipes]|uniref:DUF4175 domain-containing protein n=1 Tax=Nephila pilipes TaxID=299642 RepID=A0A8X6MW82_NEPPI|nr:hypothetical protein NPIL_370011 [Nephila pilipes]